MPGLIDFVEDWFLLEGCACCECVCRGWFMSEACACCECVCVYMHVCACACDLTPTYLCVFLVKIKETPHVSVCILCVFL